MCTDFGLRWARLFRGDCGIESAGGILGNEKSGLGSISIFGAPPAKGIVDDMARMLSV